MEERTTDAMVGYPSDGMRDTDRPAPAEWAIPAKRSDNVGLLAWRLVGGGAAVPDFTAAARLVDALMDAGDHDQANQLRQKLTRLVEDVRDASHDHRSLNRLVTVCLERTRGMVSHLLYDFESVMGVLARASELASVPDAPLEEQTSEASFVRAAIGYHGRGAHVRLPDGRHGIVVEEAGDDGRCRVLIDGPPA